MVFNFLLLGNIRNKLQFSACADSSSVPRKGVKFYKGFLVSLDLGCSQYHVQMKIFRSLYGRKKSLMVWRGVMDMDECLPLVCENKLSFSVDLAADCKSVYSWRSAHSRVARMQGRKLLDLSCVSLVGMGGLNHRHEDVLKMEMCVFISS